ncbi:hypothetical protein DOTSEDRAFT_125228 [Dothistroma septosporum NZE10]|uniref:CST complex subunit Ten1 n=1 Tax=Dothistroma septosporum (strain NZE10 / CBS 128990) TaxID=675120 RepID=N1PW91_DOTSN|nr:hypothetical protein DOTSEDRAFT_125228 [Dothistroma septosporum NZE10]
MASTDNSSYRPQPTRLVLLDEVAQQEAGTKIRFLGCVHEYNVSSGTLTLRDGIPVTTERGHTTFTRVDNEMLSLNSELLQVGTWLNIIGYVRTPKLSKQMAKIPMVDATMVWSAGAIQHAKYGVAAKSYQAIT